ncbi:MAG: hypothetical protein LBU32_06580 [Clostridiales bacterium]|jgi:hypothetical protein|nr:hypothetical protein [Clostridiales bacterium]
MAGLNAKAGAMTGRLNGVGQKLKKVERRLNTLDEHIRHSVNFKSNRRHKARYEKLYAEYEAAKKQMAFSRSARRKRLWTRRRIITKRTAPPRPPRNPCRTLIAAS